jgi:hypothetical protein
VWLDRSDFVEVLLSIPVNTSKTTAYGKTVQLLLKFYNKNFDLLLLKFYKKSTQTTAHSNTASQKDCLTTAHDQTVARLPDIFMIWHHGAIDCLTKARFVYHRLAP